MVVYRESTHIAWADHRNEQPLSSETLAVVTRKSVEDIEKSTTSKPKKRGPGWGTMLNMLTSSPNNKSARTEPEDGGASPQPEAHGAAMPPAVAPPDTTLSRDGSSLNA
jgi:hypothetical protein